MFKVRYIKDSNVTFRKGDIYTVTSIRPTKCCGERLYVIGDFLTDWNNNTYCVKCKHDHNLPLYSPNIFIRLDSAINVNTKVL